MDFFELVNEELSKLETSDIEESKGGRLIHTERLGNMEAKVYWMSEWHEFVVRFFVNKKYLGDGPDYFTDDKQDAIGTAKAELRHMSRHMR